jgi:flagellar biosynthesis component FlhA
MVASMALLLGIIPGLCSFSGEEDALTTADMVPAPEIASVLVPALSEGGGSLEPRSRAANGAVRRGAKKGDGLVTVIPSLMVSISGGPIVTRTRIAGIRRQMATELGYMARPVRVTDNLQRKASEYLVLLTGAEIARFELMPNRELAIPNLSILWHNEIPSATRVMSVGLIQ